MPKEQLCIYTRQWCEDSQAAKEFLSEHGVPFDEIDIEQNLEAARFVMSFNDGKQRTPTFAIGGRVFHCSPFDAGKLAKELNLPRGK